MAISERDALAYAMERLDLPASKALWLGGEPLAAGDLYHPCVAPASPLIDRHYATPEAVTGEYDLVLLYASKQREETEGLLALALKHSLQWVIAVAANDAGGNRLPAMLEAYGLPVGELSKQRCRVVWTSAAPNANREHIARQQQLLEMRQMVIEGTSWWSLPGLFGWDQADTGSRLLLEQLTGSLQGLVADFGCGYGYLSRHLLQRHPAITQLDAFDHDARAVACARRNGGDKLQAEWRDICRGTFSPKYQAVVMNPPFHRGRHEDVELGRTFLRQGWDALLPGGVLWAVANRHLPYEGLIPGLTETHSAQGFKILTARKDASHRRRRP